MSGDSALVKAPDAKIFHVIASFHGIRNPLAVGEVGGYLLRLSEAVIVFFLVHVHIAVFLAAGTGTGTVLSSLLKRMCWDFLFSV